jgi:hypothetical protein
MAIQPVRSAQALIRISVQNRPRYQGAMFIPDVGCRTSVWSLRHEQLFKFFIANIKVCDSKCMSEFCIKN